MAQIIDEAQQSDAGRPCSLRTEQLRGAGRSIANGFSKLIGGQELSISPERWFWGPTPHPGGDAGRRRAGHQRDADLHLPLRRHARAHDLDADAVGGHGLGAQRSAAGGDATSASAGSMLLALALLGIYVGMLRATNTWDWITFMVLSRRRAGVRLVAGARSRSTRTFWSSVSRGARCSNLAWYVGGFLIVSFARRRCLIRCGSRRSIAASRPGRTAKRRCGHISTFTGCSCSWWSRCWSGIPRAGCAASTCARCAGHGRRCSLSSS